MTKINAALNGKQPTIHLIFPPPFRCFCAVIPQFIRILRGQTPGPETICSRNVVFSVILRAACDALNYIIRTSCAERWSRPLFRGVAHAYHGESEVSLYRAPTGFPRSKLIFTKSSILSRERQSRFFSGYRLDKSNCRRQLLCAHSDISNHPS